MPLTYSYMLTNFNGNPPLDDRSIEMIQKSMGIRMPDDYLEYITFANGGEGWIGSNSYTILWKFDDLVQKNEAYQAKEYVPDLFLFGSDGGGEAYAFDRRSLPWNVVSVPFVGMNQTSCINFAPSFKEFINILFNSE
jgi:hypothetical protein